MHIARRQWILLIVLFALSLPAVTARIYSSDEIQYFAYLRSLWFDRDLSFENEYQYFYDRGIARSDGYHETFLERTTETGRRINFATLGCAILWAPFYGAGDLVARTTGASVDGYSKPYVAGVAYGSAVYGFLAIVLSILSARRLGLNAFLPAIVVWLGTPLLFYMYVAPPFSHACSAFGVALFIYVWLRVRDTWSTRGLIALGAAAALMTMIREQDAFFAVGAALDFAWARLLVLRGARSDVRGAVGVVAGIVAFAAAFTPQAAAYLILNGHVGPHSSVGHKMNWAAPHALQVLFSPEHGFFVWTPLALIALVGVLLLPQAGFLPPEGGNYNEFLPPKGGRNRRILPPEGGSYKFVRVASAFRRKEQVALCLLLMVALQIYIGGSVESWTVAGAFGQRRFIALTSILIIGVAALTDRLPASPRQSVKIVAAAVTVLAVYWNLALSAEFAIGLMDRQKLEPRKNAYDAFVTLPLQGPSLAYRYLFDRASFYKHAP